LDGVRAADAVLTLITLVAGVGSLVGLLFVAQVRALQIADTNRRELREHLRG